MPRVKRGISHVKKRRTLLKKVKGFKWQRNISIKLAKTAVVKAGAHAFVDRRKKKRNARALWQIKINAACRQHGISYSKFMGGLKKANLQLDRKILADLAEHEPRVFAAIIKEIKK